MHGLGPDALDPMLSRSCVAKDTPHVGPSRHSPGSTPAGGLKVASTKAEGGFSSEAGVIKEQARQAQPLHEGENLLQGPSGTPPADPTAKAKRP